MTDFRHIVFAERQIYRNDGRISMPQKTLKELAMELVVSLDTVCKESNGRAIFKNQLLRAASSVGANIYEAKYAQSNADFVHKMEIALKECHETEYWLELLRNVKTLDDDTYQVLQNKCGQIRCKLIASIKTVKEKYKI